MTYAQSMEWAALAFGLISAAFAGVAGTLAFRERTKLDEHGFFNVSEKGGRIALLTIAAAASAALSAIAGAVALLLR